MEHRTLAELNSYLDHVRASPTDSGRIEVIVRRPGVDQREVLIEAELSLTDGVVGDTWSARGNSRTRDGGPNPEAQITVMNARAAGVVAIDPERRPLAGDQLYVDLDLSLNNLPPGSRLAVGSAVIEITETPHTGCAKFVSRFGVDAQRWVNSSEGRGLRLRGANARVVQPGTVRVGDAARKLPHGYNPGSHPKSA